MNKKAFTLIELIVVIAIIGFLSMVGVMTFMEWFSKSRDASRIAALQNMSMALETNLARETTFPMPDDKMDIEYSGKVLSYQGKFGETVADKLPEIKKVPKDPRDNSYYTYAVDKDGKDYGLLALMEGEEEQVAYNPLIQEVYAEDPDYSDRRPVLEGRVAILLTDKNVPVESMYSGDLELKGTSTGFNLVTTTGTIDNLTGGQFTGNVLLKFVPSLTLTGLNNYLTGSN